MRCFLVTLLALLSTSQAARDSVGGGWLHGGADAEYFANPGGAPAFTA